MAPNNPAGRLPVRVATVDVAGHWSIVGWPLFMPPAEPVIGALHATGMVETRLGAGLVAWQLAAASTVNWAATQAAQAAGVVFRGPVTFAGAQEPGLLPASLTDESFELLLGRSRAAHDAAATMRVGA